MIFEALEIPGLMLVRQEKSVDSRGYFARTYCRDSFAKAGIEFDPVQCSDSFNEKKATLRGLHFQTPPHEEAKLVRCLAGSIYDVVVDLRRDSPRRGTWWATVLSKDNGDALFIPKGLAHGFQTLEDRSLVAYMIGTKYAPRHGAGIRWDDGDLDIDWPEAAERVVSDKDRALPLLREIA